MKTNKKTIRSAMDDRLSFLDELPSCRAAVQYRIAQEEEPVMKKKISLGFVFAMVLVLLAAAALATTLLLSPRANAVRIADEAVKEKYGITAELQSFFGREEKELPDGGVEVTYTGAGSMAYALGTYTVTVKDGKAAEVTWSHDGEDTSGGYDAEAWGLEQLGQMLIDCRDNDLKQAYLDRMDEIAAAHDALEDNGSSETDEGYFDRIEAQKTAALNARKLSEEEMIRIGREFIISNYNLNEEQVARLELYTNFDSPYKDLIDADPQADNGNSWYDTINGKPCFTVEYLLYQPMTEEEYEAGKPLDYKEGDGYYVVYVNVETGEIEEYIYNSGLGGQG